MLGNFIPVSLEQREKFYTCWHSTPRHALDYSLANLWGWQQFFGLEWSFEDDLCWIRQTVPGPLPTLWAPVGNWQAADWQKIFASQSSQTYRFIRVPEELMQIWQAALGERVHAEEDRGQWEYLYKQSDLATLSGNRFHKKKNHFNGYVKAYGQPEYRPLDDVMVEDVLGLQDDWCQWHECEDSPSLQAENDAINRVLSHWDMFPGLSGGSLYVDGKMVAFCVGENLGESTLGVHFEKGLNGFKGVYQAINHEFSRIAGSSFQWINRAQDLDEDGLRQAKMSYNPADFLKKYRVTIR